MGADDMEYWIATEPHEVDYNLLVENDFIRWDRCPESERPTVVLLALCARVSDFLDDLPKVGVSTFGVEFLDEIEQLPYGRMVQVLMESFQLRTSEVH